MVQRVEKKSFIDGAPASPTRSSDVFLDPILFSEGSVSVSLVHDGMRLVLSLSGVNRYPETPTIATYEHRTLRAGLGKLDGLTFYTGHVSRVYPHNFSSNIFCFKM